MAAVLIQERRNCPVCFTSRCLTGGPRKGERVDGGGVRSLHRNTETRASIRKQKVSVLAGPRATTRGRGNGRKTRGGGARASGADTPNPATQARLFKETGVSPDTLCTSNTHAGRQGKKGGTGIWGKRGEPKVSEKKKPRRRGIEFSTTPDHRSCPSDVAGGKAQEGGGHTEKKKMQSHRASQDFSPSE